MLPAIATFVFCAALILGAYWLFVVRPEEVSARALRRRLAAEPIERHEKTQLTKAPTALTALRALDVLLLRAGGASRRLEMMVRLSNLPLTSSGALGVCGLCAVLTFGAVWFLSSLPWVGVAAGALAGGVPLFYVRYVMQRRMNRFEEQLPQAIELIATSLRAGHAFSTGMLMVAEELAEPLGSEFRLLHDQQNYGKPLPEVLKEFAGRVPLLDARIFVTAVLTQRETGGNLAEVLDKLAALIRERFTVRRQVKAVSAHGRITGTVLTLLPPTIAAVMFLIVPQHVMVLVTDPIGVQLSAAAVVLQITGALAIRRIVNIEF